MTHNRSKPELRDVYPGKRRTGVVFGVNLTPQPAPTAAELSAAAEKFAKG